MRDRFTITIQDVNGVKQYTLKQFFKKFFIFLIIFIVASFVIGGSVIWYLKREVDELTNLKYELERKNELLAKRNEELKKIIAQKEQELGELIAKIQNIEEMMGAPSEPVMVAYAPQKNMKLLLPKKKENIKKKLSKLQLNLAVINYMFKHIPNGSPIGRYIRITSRYGYRYHPLFRRRKFHAGVDLAARYGQPVRATANGIVVYAGWKRGYGRTIIIRHQLGFTTLYGHLSKIRVRIGSYVRKGQVIGYAGSSGYSTGPHLHYEVRYLQRPINPVYFIRWNKKNYKYIFKRVRVVRWASLVKVISQNFQSKALKQQ
jgi:murein DD-endopeptidase MepM/ murein hydrolase activator NlpD